MWETPDGQRKIYSVNNGQYKTFADAIGTAAPGTTMDVEEYQRKSKARDGSETSETFIRPPKGEGFSGGAGGGRSSPSSGGGGGGGSDKNATFAASYAKDMIIAEANKSGTVDMSRWATFAAAIHDWLVGKTPSATVSAAASSAPTAPVTPAKQEVDLEVLNGLLEVNGLSGAVTDPAVGMGKVLTEYLEAGMDGDTFIRNLQKIYTPKPDDDKLPM